MPTLDALAATLPFADAPVCPLLDARKGEVYCSLYRWREREMTREWDYLALSPEAVAARLRGARHRAGRRRARVPAVSGALGGAVREAPPARRLPSPASVAQLGHAHARRRAAGSPRRRVTPFYLRPSEAELKARRTA